MEYEGKGNRNFDFSESSKKQKYKPVYLVCDNCFQHGEKDEFICTKCGERMFSKSTMGRADQKGNIKF